MPIPGVNMRVKEVIGRMSNNFQLGNWLIRWVGPFFTIMVKKADLLMLARHYLEPSEVPYDPRYVNPRRPFESYRYFMDPWDLRFHELVYLVPTPDLFKDLQV